MDQTFINLVIGLAGALGGFVLKTMWEAVKDLQKADTELIQKVNEMEVLVAGNYVKRGELAELSRAIFAQLDRIEGKVDHKADK